MLGEYVERELGQKQVGPHPCRGRDAGLFADGRHHLRRQRARVGVVEREVGCRLDEAFVDTVDVQVRRGDETQVDRDHLRGDLHVAAHARHGNKVLDSRGDIADAAAVFHAECLHGRRDGQAYCVGAARGIGHHQIGREWVEAAVGTFHTRIERLQVDAHAHARRFRFPCHSPSL